MGKTRNQLIVNSQFLIIFKFALPPPGKMAGVIIYPNFGRYAYRKTFTYTSHYTTLRDLLNSVDRERTLPVNFGLLPVDSSF